MCDMTYPCTYTVISHIDSSLSNTNTNNSLTNLSQDARGYDFTHVCQWFAERSDLILLFFDPDKPGTTYETLSILIHALHGLDYKLRIILNKADSFINIYDFARCYGTLCWNLAKVIPRKDLPPIYTMCVYPSSKYYTNTNIHSYTNTNAMGNLTPVTLPSSTASGDGSLPSTQPNPGLTSAIQDLLTTRYIIMCYVCHIYIVCTILMHTVYCIQG